MIKLCAIGLSMVLAAFMSVPAYIVSTFGVDLQAAYYINIASFWSGVALSVLALAGHFFKRSSNAAES